MIRITLQSINHSKEQGGVELIKKWQTQGGIIWVDIVSKIDNDAIVHLEQFGCHPLAIEELQRHRHPPKFEAFDNHLFVIFRGLTHIDEKLNLFPQQISFFIGQNFLITCHEGASVSIDHHWSKESTEQISPEILALNIMHYSSGRYLETILEYETTIGEIEDGMLSDSAEIKLTEVAAYRSQLRKLKRIFSYHEKLSKGMLDHFLENHVGQDEVMAKHDARALYDRCERLNSLTGMYYEISSDLIDSYISITSHQLNNTMRILTVITAIFVPLSFLAGLYGMNFENIPELKQPNGYFILLGTMTSLAFGMVWYFKRNKWF